MNDLNKQAQEALLSLDQLCETLAKAIGANLGKVPANRNVPDVTPEQIYAARGSVMPIDDGVAPGPKPAAQPEDVMPSLPEETAANLSQYTPEKLEELVHHAAKNIAEVLFSSLLSHAKGEGGRPRKSA